MAGKADFTEDEWKGLQQGVTGAGMLVSTAHRDFTDSFGEASTVVKQLGAHGDSESELVRELSETRGTGFGVFSSPKEVGQGTIDALSASVAVLGQKAPDELEAYRASRAGHRHGGCGGQGRGQGRGESGDREDHGSSRTA